MILHSSVDVKQLCELGKDYPWQKPAGCPVCRSNRLWGHGFVVRYFEPLDRHLWIKRYRCPDCNAVHTFRPHGYLQAFRYPLRVILLCLFIRVTTNTWTKKLYRQIQQGWWRTLHRSASRSANSSVADFSRLVIGLLFWFVLCDVLLL